MVTSLIQHERILTTHTKAKYAQRYAERMVAYAKDNTVHAKRKVGAFVRGEEAFRKLFNILGQRYASETKQADAQLTGCDNDAERERGVRLANGERHATLARALASKLGAALEGNRL